MLNVYLIFIFVTYICVLCVSVCQESAMIRKWSEQGGWTNTTVPLHKSLFSQHIHFDEYISHSDKLRGRWVISYDSHLLPTATGFAPQNVKADWVPSVRALGFVTPIFEKLPYRFGRLYYFMLLSRTDEDLEFRSPFLGQYIEVLYPGSD